MELQTLEQTKRRLDAVSPSFCLAKWLQVTLHLYKGSTQSCHHVLTHQVSPDELAARPSALHNSAFKISVREDMLAGRFPPECQYCWNIEKLGHYSDRIHKSAAGWATPFFEEASASASKHITPSYLEVAFDNVCNFKCMYCSPAFSSLWEQEILKHGPYPTTSRFNDLETIDREEGKRLSPDDRAKYIAAFWAWWPELAPRLEHLRVTGGEPLLSRETWKLMDELEKTKLPRLTFGVNSNLSLSTAQMDRLVDKLNRLGPNVAQIIVHCSVDTVGKQAEYIRNGLDYERFVANTERLLRDGPPNLQLSYMITVTALSLPGTRSLIRRIAEQRASHTGRTINLDTPYLRNPEFLSVLILPKTYRVLLLDAIAEMPVLGFTESEIQKLQRIADLMQANPIPFMKKNTLRRDFSKFLREHDRRRKTSVRETFPEYAKFLDACDYRLGIDFSELLGKNERSS